MNAVPAEQNRDPRRWWRVVTSLIAFAVLMEAVFAGAMLSGVGWARTAHAVDAAIVIAAALVAGLICLITFRGVANGFKLGLILLSLAAVVFVQAALGALAAKGMNLLWIHIPLGVALFGFTVRAMVTASRLPASDVKAGIAEKSFRRFSA